MKKILKFLVLNLLVFAGLQSCKKDKKVVQDPQPDTTTAPTTPSGPSASMKVRFNNEVDGEALQFGKNYTNAKGESYSVSKFNYYISNVSLTKTDNSVVTLSNIYQIVKQSDDNSKTLELKDIPPGSYKAVKLMLGVDSASNCSGAHSGGLDFVYASDMFWSWNQGYIFLKLEGTSAAISGADFEYHLGGFGGPNKAQRNVVINFGTEEAKVSTISTPTLILSVNVNEIFKDPTTLSIAQYPSVLNAGSAQAKMIADNYADMIKLSSLKNP